MGGTTSVTLRKPDGREYRMTRWTNSMPWGICNAKMFDADKDHMNKYLFNWVDMKRDYEEHKDSGNFEHDMTSCYFPSAGLAPCGYGLTVVDHVTQTLFDMQGYTAFDYMHPFSINSEWEANKETGKADPDGDLVRFKDFFDTVRFMGAFTGKTHDEGREYDPWDYGIVETLDKIAAANGAGDSFKIDIYKLVMDIKPFTLKTFEESSIGAASMFACLEEAGFEFNDAEREEWADWIRERKECEEEDGDWEEDG